MFVFGRPVWSIVIISGLFNVPIGALVGATLTIKKLYLYIASAWLWWPKFKKKLYESYDRILHYEVNKYLFHIEKRSFNIE